VKQDVHGLDFIMKLRPVTYYLDIAKYDEYVNTPEALEAMKTGKPMPDPSPNVKPNQPVNLTTGPAQKGNPGASYAATPPKGQTTQAEPPAIPVATTLADPNASANGELYEEAVQRASSIRHNGFIAQEVEATADSIGYNFDGVHHPESNNDTYGLTYGDFVVPLVKAVQEQEGTINKQQATIDSLKNQNAELLKRIEAIEKKIQ
jgi:hypothetical protein